MAIRFCFVLLGQRSLRVGGWLLMLLMDVMLLADLATRLHPTWRVHVSSLLGFGFLALLVLGLVEWALTLPLTPWRATSEKKKGALGLVARLLVGAPLWATLHAVLLGISVLLLSYPVVTALVGAHRWWTESLAPSFITYTKFLDFAFAAARPAMMMALSRWVLHFGYRRSIYRRGYDNTELCLVVVGLSWLLLAQVGTEPLMDIPEKYDARPALTDSERRAAELARQVVWSTVQVIAGGCVLLGLVLSGARWRWLRSVRRSQIDGWRVVPTQDVPAITFCRAPWSAGGAALQKQQDSAWQSVGSVSAQGTQHRLSGQEAPVPSLPQEGTD